MSSYRGRSSEGKQPARVDVAHTRSAIGDMASENWPIDLSEMDALENLDNWRLGDLHGEIVGARVHYGAELKKYQDAINRYRAQRARVREELAGRSREERSLDAALDRHPVHQKLHRVELLCRKKARDLNGKLWWLNLALEVVEEEMANRIMRIPT